MTSPFGALVAAVALTMGAGQASADESSFWVTPGEIDGYEQKLFEASRLAEAAIRIENRAHDDIDAQEKASQLAERAIKTLEAASALRPDDAEPHYRITFIIENIFAQGPNTPRHRLVQQVRHLDAVIEKDPLHFDLNSMYFTRSIALTKLGGKDNLLKAVADYDRSLQMYDPSSTYSYTLDSIATRESNRAELLMALGRLDEAIQGYEDSLQHKDDPLYGYGLAVALDRDGQKARAREVMKHYAQRDGSKGKTLTKNGTFFVPEGEIFYYQALLAEVLGQPGTAAALYKQFLQVLPGSQWAERAKENIETLRKTHKLDKELPRQLRVLRTRGVLPRVR